MLAGMGTSSASTVAGTGSGERGKGYAEEGG